MTKKGLKSLLESTPSQYHRNWAFSNTITPAEPLTAETFKRLIEQYEKRIEQPPIEFISHAEYNRRRKGFKKLKKSTPVP